MASAELLDADRRDRLLGLIQESLSIRSHLEFFVWMQLGIREFLSHDVLIASWGNFVSGELNFDISSALPGVRTGKWSKRPDLVPFAQGIQDRWQRLDRKPFCIKQEKENEALGDFPSLDTHNLSSAQSFLVHGIHDKRDNNDCLYVFVDYHHGYDQETRQICNLLLPHIDAALRRVDTLPSPPQSDSQPALSTLEDFGISDREKEIMQWVCIGKTNPEIGLILGISANTVKNHLKRIFEKLDVTNRAQAVSKFKVDAVHP